MTDEQERAMIKDFHNQPIQFEKRVRSEDEIRAALIKINERDDLTFGYRSDVSDVLCWVLMDEPFLGIDREESEELPNE